MSLKSAISLPVLIVLFSSLNFAHAQKSDTSSITIKGKAVDYHSNEALKKIELEIKGTENKTITDNYGRFKFILPKTFWGKQIEIGPSDATEQFLDSTASIMPAETVQTDTLSFKNPIVMYRYPIDTLSTIPIITQRPKFITSFPVY